jgi:hypothetical protein
MMHGAIDIICNLFTPQEVAARNSGIDDHFKSLVRMPEQITRGG